MWQISLTSSEFGRVQFGGSRFVDLLDEIHVTQQVCEGHEEGEGHLFRAGRRPVRSTHLQVNVMSANILVSTKIIKRTE